MIIQSSVFDTRIMNIYLKQIRLLIPQIIQLYEYIRLGGYPVSQENIDTLMLLHRCPLLYEIAEASSNVALQDDERQELIKYHLDPHSWKQRCAEAVHEALALCRFIN